MKKILLTLSLGIIILAGSAQNDSLVTNVVESNNFLPKAGDIAIGVEADPFINFIGNMFNGTSGNSLNLNNNTLYFRYYLSRNAAIRLSLNIAASSDVDKFYVRDDAAVFADPLSKAQVEDQYITSDRNYNVRLGYQKFYNYSRFRAYYGGDLGYQYSRFKEEYQYGNEMTTLNTSPTTNWGSLATRDLEINNAAVHGIGLNGFVGAEYYFLPKICIGGELGLSYYYGFQGQSHKTQETMVLTQHVEQEIATSPGDVSTSFNSNYPYYFGNLYIMFHF